MGSLFNRYKKAPTIANMRAEDLMNNLNRLKSTDVAKYIDNSGKLRVLGCVNEYYKIKGTTCFQIFQETCSASNLSAQQCARCHKCMLEKYINGEIEKR